MAWHNWQLDNGDPFPRERLAPGDILRLLDGTELVATITHKTSGPTRGRFRLYDSENCHRATDWPTLAAAEAELYRYRDLCKRVQKAPALLAKLARIESGGNYEHASAHYRRKRRENAAINLSALLSDPAAVAELRKLIGG